MQGWPRNGVLFLLKVSCFSGVAQEWIVIFAESELLLRGGLG